MPSSAVLAARTYQDVAFVLFLEGWRYAFTNHVELVGEGPGSWIGTSEGGRAVVLGLEQPDNIKHSISIEAGLPADNDVSFTIVDMKGLLVRLFDETTEPEQVFERLGPLDDPAPAVLLGQADDVVVDLHGRFINGESIGPAGERRRHQVLPGAAGQLPGYDHGATVDDQYLAPSQVTSEARWFEGRRMSLYLIRRDTNTGEWVTWQDAETSGYGRLWWGTARSARVTGRAWTISADGVGSWLRGGLNRLRPSAWAKVTSSGLDITPEQGYCAIALRYIQAANGIIGETVECGISLFEAGDLIAEGGDGAIEVREQISARIKALVSETGPGDAFDEFKNGYADLLDDQERATFRIRVPEDPNSEFGGEMWIALHETVWRWLGFDPKEQHVPQANIASEFEIHFVELSGYWVPGAGVTKSWADVGAEPPAPGYYAALISTCPMGGTFVQASDNEGQPRYHRALNPDSVMMIYPGKKLAVGNTDNVPYVGGQLMRPVDDVTFGLSDTPADTTGFIALRGQLLKLDDKGEPTEPETITTIWKASWYDAQGKFGIDTSNLRNTVYLSHQLDPRPFGFANAKAPTNWAVIEPEWTSVAVFGHAVEHDRAHAVLLRMMLSTGTASWTGVGENNGAQYIAGQNGHPDAPFNFVGNDLEVADLGFGVPAALVDWASFYAEAAALPGGYDSGINRCRIGRIGPVDGGELFRQVLEPRGWAVGLQGGRYTLFSRARPLDVAESVVTLSHADLDSRDEPFIEQVDLYPLTPIDRLTCTYGQSPDGSGETKEYTGQARDPGAWRRSGGAVKDVDGSTLIPYTTGTEPIWLSDFRQIWERGLAAFFGAPHIVVEVPVKVDRARDIWPGSIVRFSSPWPANREGSYGLAGRVGRVLSTTQDLQTTLTKKVRILIAPGDPLAVRRFAPIAQVLDVVDTLEQRHDAATRTLVCYQDAFLHGGASRDVAGFAEPEWLGVGGDAKCVGYQHDGRSWSQTFGFTLESVDVEANTLTYKPGSLTGKFWERRWTLIVLAKWEDQDENSWPRALFGVTTRPSGLFGTGDHKGWKFK